MSSKVDEKKSTKVTIPPKELRDSVAEIMNKNAVGMDPNAQAVIDGTYDLEHLQAWYAGGDLLVQLCVAVLAAWAHVYPRGQNGNGVLDGGTDRFDLRDGARVLPPTGQPFETVGTAYARSTIRALVEIALDSIDDAEEREDGADDGRLLLDVLAHRDHLHAQVGEVQARNAVLEVANRKMRIWSEGIVARLSAGAEEPACPYRSDDDAAVVWWTQGYAHANSLVTSKP